MNYFPFHVGDYAAHTAHLEPMEDLAYRRLLDLYYLREGPLPADIQVTAKLVRMRSMSADVDSVLREFFTLTDEGWRHSRCDAEITEMLRRQQMAKDKANKRWQQHGKELGNAAASIPDAAADAAASKSDAVAMLPTPTPTPTPTPVVNIAGSAKRRTQLPGDFAPSEAGKRLADEKGLSLAAELQRFSDYHAGKGSVMADWQAAWRTWVGNAKPARPLASLTESNYTRQQREKWETLTGRTSHTTDATPQFLEIAQ